MGKAISKRIVQINELFKENRFYIPNYQRNYTWKLENAKTLIKDILGNSGYFIGNIILNKKEDFKYEIIDGQQRLITCYLILLVYRNSNYLGERDKKTLNKMTGTSDEGLRINNEAVLEDASLNILKYLYNNSSIPAASSKNTIVQMYKKLKKYLETMSSQDKKTLFGNLKNTYILYIDTSKSSITSYQLFLNLNTKGLKLSNLDIIKSYIFNQICSLPSFQAIKSDWYDSISTIDEKDYDDYLSIYSNLSNQISTKTQKKEISEQIISSIDARDKAMNAVKILGSKESKYFAAYKAVRYKDCENDYIQYFDDGGISIKPLFGHLTFIKKISFIQFNIALISILTFSNKSEKNRIMRDVQVIDDFIQYIFLYSAKKMLDHESPSTYGNKFIKFATDVYQNKDKICESIGKIVKGFGGDRDMQFKDLTRWNDKVFSQNSKALQIAVALISYLDGDTTLLYSKGEHFIPDSDAADLNRHLFSNIIPVASDPYSNKTKAQKIPMYLANRTSEPHIDMFLNKDYDPTTGVCDLEKRLKRYKKLFIKKFNELRGKLVAFAPANGETL
ncbi:MAG: DUF262 domain-containing protein [Bacilli bacterium]|nr:DUF262 domain-containing protein [Bacilli bacterium]